MRESPLASWMKKKGLRQQDLAKKLGCPQASISAYLLGKRGFRPARYKRLARITGIPIGDLYAWTVQNQAHRTSS